MHIDLTFYTIFVPRTWFQVSGFGCQERKTQSHILNTDTRNLTPKKRNKIGIKIKGPIMSIFAISA
jgi:hypothetical protein